MSKDHPALLRVKVGSLHKYYAGGLPISKCKRCLGTGLSTNYPPSFGGEMECPVCHGTGAAVGLNGEGADK